MGNYDAIVMERFTRRLLAQAGVHEDRFSLDWASAAQAPLYVDLITTFTRRLKELGTLGASDGKTLEQIRRGLAAAKAAASSVKLRTQFAKFTLEMRRENDYSPPFLEAKMAEKLNDAIVREMEKDR